MQGQTTPEGLGLTGKNYYLLYKPNNNSIN